MQMGWKHIVIGNALAILVFMSYILHKLIKSNTNDTCSFESPYMTTTDILNCNVDTFEFSQPVTLYQPKNGKHTLAGLRHFSGPPPIPIFILFADKVTVLLETLRSFHRYIRTPFEIIILDNKSTYPRAVAFLKRLEEAGVKIYRLPQTWSKFNELHDIAVSFIEVHMINSASDYYIFTDADCALDSAPHNILDVYKAALDNLDYNLIGAAIRWDDLSEAVRKQKKEYLYLDGHRDIKSFMYQDSTYYYAPALVDTTFAMARKGTRLARLKQTSIRMLSPLGIRHVDFYLDPKNLPHDYVYYIQKARSKDPDLNHMNVFQVDDK
jgi:hypothetical protein